MHESDRFDAPNAADRTMGRDGFTLLELLVVTLVILVLVSLLLPAITKSTGNAR